MYLCVCVVVACWALPLCCRVPVLNVIGIPMGRSCVCNLECFSPTFQKRFQCGVFRWALRGALAVEVARASQLENDPGLTWMKMCCLVLFFCACACPQLSLRCCCVILVETAVCILNMACRCVFALICLFFHVSGAARFLDLPRELVMDVNKG